MSLKFHQPAWRRTALLAIGSLLLQSNATAQLAPVAGEHYAKDTSAGAVNARGGYSTSVDLDFSVTDGSLPLPVAVTYGGRRVGAAGLGWDLPLSYIYHDATTAHRRPESATQGHERWTLALLGQRIELLPKNGSAGSPPTVWVAQSGSPQLEVRSVSGGESMLVYDGEGRTYSFDSRDLTPGTSGQHLANGNLYVLTAITGPGNRKVAINYNYTHPVLPGGGTGVSIDPSDVLYDYAGGSCYKHRALLRYTGGTTPIAMTMLGSTVMVRTQTLSFIGVNGQRTCGAGEERIRTYDFAYQNDADTGLPQLQSVTVSGQQGTPEATVKLPVASYGYGSIVDPSKQQITYAKAATGSPPFVAGASTYLYGLGYTFPAVSTEPHSSDDVLSDLTTGQTLLDLNGDGRVDFYNGAGFYPNTADPSGLNAYTTGGMSGTSVDVRGLVHSAVIGGATRHDRASDTTLNDTLRMDIDMNGDGRVDVVETVLPDTAHWIIHLNTPDPTDPRKVVWVDVTVPVARLRAALATTGLNFGRVPMMRNTSMPNLYAHCWSWDGTNGRWQAAGNSICSDIPANYSVSKTITEFELVDVNGDGYPDFVFNASHVTTGDAMVKPPIPTNPVNGQHASTIVSADMAGSHDVKVLINTAGAHLANGVDLFDPTPMTLEVGGTTGCGVARWVPDDGIVATDSRVGVNQTCGFQDVNGDGLVDRVVTQGSQTVATLGTGDTNAPFASAAKIALPGPIGRTEAPVFHVQDEWQTPCNRVQGQQYYDIQRTRGLRDINGDGIADYVSGTRSGNSVNWSVALGNGTGYAAPAAVTSPVGLELSLERTFCADLNGPVPIGTASTPTGLYDLDGDGQPEVVNMVPVAGTTGGNWDIYQLQRYKMIPPLVGTTASVPEAGRLTAINNGYGAVTTIGYKSAKEAYNALRHQVAGPEIVVTSMTALLSSLSSGLTVSRYAYGDIGMYFDAAADAFVPSGYGRSVQLQLTVDGSTTAATASISDRYGPQAYVSNGDTAFGNALLIGLPGDVTTLSDANLGSDPWPLLTANVATDTRRIAGSHHAWATRLLPATARPAGNAACANVNPYAYVPGPTDDMCVKSGFVFETANVAWRGAPGSDAQPALSRNVVATDREVKATDVDDFGRVAAVGQYNDLNRSDDDQCVRVVYGQPASTSTRPRVLNRPVSRIVTNCASPPVTLSKESWEYDTANGTKLPAGQVTNGFVTAAVVTRLDEQGAPILDATGKADIRRFDAILDGHGNPTMVSTVRDDGAVRTTTTTFDDFGLVATGQEIAGTNANGTTLPRQSATLTHDMLTLNPLTSTDANGGQAGTTYDGFGRVLTSTVVPVGGSGGVMAALSYAGFAVGDTGLRRVTRKIFTDPVPAANVATAPGGTATTFFDLVGRVLRTEVNLGPDYGNQTMILGQRTYDLQGRVKFIADPFLSTQSYATAYGTTNYFNADGTRSCSIRGKGVQSFTRVTNEVNEVYPTCFGRSYADGNNTAVYSVQTPDALLPGASQAGVKRLTTLSAIGLPLMQSLVQTDLSGGVVNTLERTRFGYDNFGRRILMQRFRDPNNLLDILSTTWHYDSLGQVTELDEPSPNVPQRRSYDSWGEWIATGWCDAAVGSCTASVPTNRGSVVSFDAYGRTIHREDRRAGAVVPETQYDYLYDVGVNNAIPSVVATNVLGRLAKASSPTESQAFSYDGYGRIAAIVHTDRTVAPSVAYVEKRAYRGDGSTTSLDLLLPDTSGYADERVDYAYDALGRVRSAIYAANGASQTLFDATGSTDIDTFGNLRHALYGASIFDASYASNGRRLLTDVKVSSPSPLATSREISFAPVAGTIGAVTAFDPVGRERIRRESVDGVAGDVKANFYDPLGRLWLTEHYAGGADVLDRSFTYDPIGNLVSQSDPTTSGTGTVKMLYRTDDRDRLCSIAYGNDNPSQTCNVSYDAAGNLVQQPQPRVGGKTRTFDYFANGQIRQVFNASGSLRTDVATIDYDAFDTLQRLTLASSTSPDIRNDKHFGPLITRRDEAGVSTVTRAIPIPGGTATRHGPNGTWTFSFGEARGTRFVTDQAGRFVQSVDYLPFGEVATKTGATPGSVNYTNEQWNGGDLLAAFGLNLVGLRVYDPIVGRFTSRDPLIDAGNSFNAYAFAGNDPVNASDPTGAYIDDKPPLWCEPNCSKGSDPGSSPPPYQLPMPGPGPELPQIPDPPPASPGPISLPALPGGGYGVGAIHGGTSSSGDRTLVGGAPDHAGPCPTGCHAYDQGSRWTFDWVLRAETIKAWREAEVTANEQINEALRHCPTAVCKRLLQDRTWVLNIAAVSPIGGFNARALLEAEGFTLAEDVALFHGATSESPLLNTGNFLKREFFASYSPKTAAVFARRAAGRLAGVPRVGLVVVPRNIFAQLRAANLVSEASIDIGGRELIFATGASDTLNATATVIPLSWY